MNLLFFQVQTSCKVVNSQVNLWELEKDKKRRPEKSKLGHDFIRKKPGHDF